MLSYVLKISSLLLVANAKDIVSQCRDQDCTSKETCYKPNDNEGYCVRNCVSYCPSNKVCEDRSDEGLGPRCLDYSTCGTTRCNFDEGCYIESNNSPTCIPNCRNWKCSDDETCVDHSHEGKHPNCEPKLKCGGSICDVHEVCHTDTQTCLATCKNTWCPQNTICVERLEEGYPPICNNLGTPCGSVWCSRNQTCFDPPFYGEGPAFCVPNCEGWECSECETCVDRSHEGMPPTCKSSILCGSASCDSTETCYTNTLGTSFCIASCAGIICSEGEVCIDRSHQGMTPMCKSSVSCGISICSFDETCNTNSKTKERYCSSNNLSDEESISLLYTCSAVAFLFAALAIIMYVRNQFKEIPELTQVSNGKNSKNWNLYSSP